MSSASAIAAALRERQSFLLTSHARPDGDAIGSELALAFALDSLGKSIRIVNHDPIPAPYRPLPGVDRIEVADRSVHDADALVVMECGDLTRPGVAGLERYFTINIDHHLGNTMYGDVNWFDASACACTELVAEVIDALGVTWTREIATHLYLGITTDTGSFRYGSVTARTFDICRRIAQAGVEPSALSRQIFDSNSIGRVRLTGAMLNAMELHHGNRLAVLSFDDALLASCGATADDTEGLVNLPLGARDVDAVALFKRVDADTWRVSLRSKGKVDVRAVAGIWQGGGHTNASGLTISPASAEARAALIHAMGEAINRA